MTDLFGHGCGDELLRAVGARLRGAIRTGDTAARPGGDEFDLSAEDLLRRADLAMYDGKRRGTSLLVLHPTQHARAGDGNPEWQLEAESPFGRAPRHLLTRKEPEDRGR